jgi:hypothetical protein
VNSGLVVDFVLELNSVLAAVAIVQDTAGPDTVEWFVVAIVADRLVVPDTAVVGADKLDNLPAAFAVGRGVSVY